MLITCKTCRRTITAELTTEHGLCRRCDERRFEMMYAGCGQWDRRKARRGLMRREERDEQTNSVVFN